MRDRLSYSSLLPLRNRGSRASTAQRPSISGPVGPVHHSNGPDIERAEYITIVSSINEVTKPQPGSLEQPSSVSQHHRQKRPASGLPRSTSGTATPQKPRERANVPDPASGMGRQEAEIRQPKAHNPVIPRSQTLHVPIPPPRSSSLKHRYVLGEISNANRGSPRVSSRNGASNAYLREGKRPPNPTAKRRSTGSSKSSHGARRLSASFSGGGPLSSHPTVASFDVHAVGGAAAGGNDENSLPSSKPREGTALSPSEHSSSFVAASIPGSNFESRLPGRRSIEKRQLPKSRTMTALSNLTASLSKSTLTGFAGSERKLSHQSNASRKVSNTSTLSTGTFTTSASTASTLNAHDKNPLIITTAQPSEYWSGRFLALHDRIRGEDLQPQALPILVSAYVSRSSHLPDLRTAYQNRDNLPLSTTTALDGYDSDAINREADRLTDDNNRCMRVFLHLDSLCTTPEAQKSLQSWQEVYARTHNRDALLPRGVTMEKGFVNRLFGGRRSIGVNRPEKQVIEGKYRIGKRVSIL
ncbi:uncharacterized protein CTRU02_210671 [Colletotrichum truncatum]|uniref:Uncharacterized protein n=1 Tax=Colletotrichum truncatum TaxID=5467 RepID=A0ACC3YPM4_COLTU|nr:uncharacterized protein CTRU02_03836 [Colletotrichum truncatum]KAF6796858.1 hypothetical protein CTRU02_03836 [Colletotrichum truncatum]